MQREIKIKFNKVGRVDKNFFPFKVLFDNFNIKVVENSNEAEVIFEMAWRDGDYNFLKGNKKVIVITAEDLFIKRNIFNLLESFISKLGFENIKYRIMDKLDGIIPYHISRIPILYFMGKYLDFVKKIEKGEIKKGYAIIQNNIEEGNIFILPYFLQGYYYDIPKLIKRPLERCLDKKRFCVFVVSSNSSRERVKFFKKLSKYKKIDSYGKVMNNMGNQIQHLNYVSNSSLFKKYKFVICFENDFHEEYITEKLINVMLADTIPIYRGAPDVGKYFNTKSFINYEDYGLYDGMIKKVIELDQDDKKYEEFLKEPWFRNNKIPKVIKDKEKDLIKFYKKVFDS